MKGILEQMAGGFALLGANKDSPFKYPTTYDYVAKEGQEFLSSPLTDEEWAILEAAAKQALDSLHEKDFPIKQCFSNSQALVMFDPAKKLQYVEGFCLGIIPIHHGWVTINGKVIDVTMRIRKGEAFDRKLWGNRCIGEFAEGRLYCGKVFETQYVSEQVVARSQWGSLIDNWEEGFPLLRGEEAVPRKRLRRVGGSR